MYKTIPPRLRWACRRGMLELDLLLNNFLEEAFLALSEQEQDLFVQLLDTNDQDLFLWLMGKEDFENQPLRPIIEKVRQHAEHRY